MAGLVIVETDALGAQLGIDDVNLVAFADGFVWTLGLASAAVDAVCGDKSRHKPYLLRVAVLDVKRGLRLKTH